MLRLALALSDHKRLLAKAHRQLLTDSLTGLANRRKLLLDLEKATADSDQRLFVLYDLNGFKHFNDSFGHPAGDVLLARLAHRLQHAVRLDGCAYRLGGDEFCILVGPTPARFEQLLHATHAALSDYGHGYCVSSSCGAVLLPDEADGPSSALMLADQRLYRNKRRNRSTYDPLQTSSAASEPVPDHRHSGSEGRTSARKCEDDTLVADDHDSADVEEYGSLTRNRDVEDTADRPSAVRL
jgi:diguanylate cyclase (GGDEF)-like protein